MGQSTTKKVFRESSPPHRPRGWGSEAWDMGTGLRGDRSYCITHQPRTGPDDKELASRETEALSHQAKRNWSP